MLIFDAFTSTRGLVLNCPFCALNCLKATKLTHHLKRKICPRQYQCDICGMAFRTSSVLTKHKKEMHKDTHIVP